ncbi:MAG: hypothetical protein ABIV21_07890, partial [Pyrinomonadaceae bacterium]
VASYSMVALANTGKAAGELMINGASNEASSVTVNGEPAASGRTIYSSSTVSTPEGVSASVNFGKAGTISFGPNTTFTLSFGGSSIGGDLTSGSISVLNAAHSVGVRTLSGQVLQLAAGETATAGSGNASQQTTKTAGGPDWWVFALIFGAAAAGIIWAASADNDNKFGASATTVSPVR